LAVHQRQSAIEPFAFHAFSCGKNKSMSIGFPPPCWRLSRQVRGWYSLRSQRLCVEKIASGDSELEMGHY